jgi:hypothetical protein
MDPNDFGPPMWESYHIMAAGAKTDIKRLAFKKYATELLQILLPCDTCSNHYIRILKKHPIEQYMDSHERLLFWSYLIHEEVNKDLGKQGMPYSDVRRKYLPELNTSIVCKTTCLADEDHVTVKKQPKNAKTFYYRAYP